MTEQPHRILIVGVGSIGERHARCFLETGRTQVSICDINNRFLRRVADAYSVENSYSNFHDALESAPDAVVIATPANLHLEMASVAAESGCHVLIEKPLSVVTTGVQRLQDAIATQDRQAMVAYVMRSHPMLRSMKEAIDEGRFGKPLHMYANCGQHFPTYRPGYREIYYRSRETGGGAIQDGLTHILDACQWLVGPIDRMAADAAHQKLEGVTVEDTVNVIARHGSVLANYSFNQHQAPNETSITVVCQNGTVRFEYHRCQWSWMTEPDTEWQTEKVKGFHRDLVFIHQANRFLDLMEGSSANPCSLEDGIKMLKVNLAVLDATQSPSWIHL